MTVVGAASAVAAVPGRAGAVATRATAVPSRPVWLCRTGQANDPCTSSVASTSVTADGSATASTPSSAPASNFDCFSVYPTTSTQTTANANLRPARGPALCRITVSALLGPDWGYHLDEVNLALGNLVADVATEEGASHH
jgi:hypothetical protein